MKYHAILSAIYRQPHMIRPEKLQEICELVALRSEGEPGDEKRAVNRPTTNFVAVASGNTMREIDSAAASGPQAGYVAIVPLFGTMLQHSMVTAGSGGTSTARLGAELSRLDADPQIGSILLEIHSPGGQVYGAFELADQISAMQTRTVALANSEMASAALLVGTAADAVYATTSASVGSIGVVTVHTDVSQAEQAAGVITTVVAAPPAKAAGHPYAPLPEDVLLEMEMDIEDTYLRFRDAVAAHRGVSSEAVEADFGGGRMLRADQAADVGLVDGIQTKVQLIEAERQRLSRPTRQSNRNKLKLSAATGGVA